MNATVLVKRHVGAADNVLRLGQIGLPIHEGKEEEQEGLDYLVLDHAPIERNRIFKALVQRSKQLGRQRGVKVAGG